jgi:ribosome biogenesis GTPase A
LIDIVVEVRDARAISSTTNPQISFRKTNFVHIIVVNRSDMVTEKDLLIMKASMRHKPRLFINGRSGKGIGELGKVIRKIGDEINDERVKRGIKSRPVRCVVVGFPNVGKSTIINNLVGRRTCACAAKPGLTRSYRWVKLNNELEILDGPGILPSHFNEESRAFALAIIGSIDDAAYESITVSSTLINSLRGLPITGQVAEAFRRRYKVQLESILTSQELIQGISSLNPTNNTTKTASKMLIDFRELRMGPISFEI